MLTRTPRPHEPRHRRLGLALAAVVAGTTTAIGGVGAGAVPRFTVTATQFRAVDETGTDWLGADEIHFGAVDRQAGHQIAITKLWTGLDTGDTRQVPSTQRCLNHDHLAVDRRSDGQPEGYEEDEWSCVGAPSIDLEIDVWEKEGDDNPWNFEPGPIGSTRLDNEDEHVGTFHLERSSAELKVVLDQVGESFTWEQPFTRSGHYTVTLTVKRVNRTKDKATEPQKPEDRPDGHSTRSAGQLPSMDQCQGSEGRLKNPNPAALALSQR